MQESDYLSSKKGRRCELCRNNTQGRWTNSLISTGITSLMPWIRKSVSKRMMVQARTSSSGKTWGSKCQRLREWMSRDLTDSGRASGTLYKKVGVWKRIRKENVRVQAMIVDGIHSLIIHIAQQLCIDCPVKQRIRKEKERETQRNSIGKESPPIQP